MAFSYIGHIKLSLKYIKDSISTIANNNLNVPHMARMLIKLLQFITFPLCFPHSLHLDFTSFQAFFPKYVLKKLDCSMSVFSSILYIFTKYLNYDSDSFYYEIEQIIE